MYRADLLSKRERKKNTKYIFIWRYWQTMAIDM